MREEGGGRRDRSYGIVGGECVGSLSVSKWIHLNWGDAGLKKALGSMFRVLRPVRGSKYGRYEVEYNTKWPHYVWELVAGGGIDTGTPVVEVLQE